MRKGHRSALFVRARAALFAPGRLIMRVLLILGAIGARSVSVLFIGHSALGVDREIGIERFRRYNFLFGRSPLKAYVAASVVAGACTYKCKCGYSETNGCFEKLFHESSMRKKDANIHLLF